MYPTHRQICFFKQFFFFTIFFFRNGKWKNDGPVNCQMRSFYKQFCYSSSSYSSSWGDRRERWNWNWNWKDHHSVLLLLHPPYEAATRQLEAEAAAQQQQGWSGIDRPNQKDGTWPNGTWPNIGEDVWWWRGKGGRGWVENKALWSNWLWLQM